MKKLRKKLKINLNTWQYKISRKLWLLVQSVWYTAIGVANNRLNVHAAACTYYFLVSLVPIVVLTGWGASNILADYDTLGIFYHIPIYNQVQEFADSMGVVTSNSIKVVGIFGVVYGLWSAASLIRSLSNAFRVIFPAKGTKKSIIIRLGTYVFIPLFLVVVILFAFLTSALSELAMWMLADILDVATEQQVGTVLADLIAVIFVIMAAYISYTFLSPKKPTNKAALIGSTLFGIYFIILQNIMLGMMSSMIEKYYIYGALGSLLLMLLWIFLIFFGLFVLAQYTSVVSGFRQLNYYRYIYISLKKRPFLFESIMMTSLPFADVQYLTHLAKDKVHTIPEPDVALIVMKAGKIRIDKDGGSQTVKKGERILLTKDIKEFTALEDSHFMIVSERVMGKLFKYYPEIWDHIKLQNLHFH